MKKLYTLITTMIILMLCTTMTLAATGKTTLELVEDKVCHIDFDGKGEFEKKLTSIDEEKKEAILTLTIKNTQTEETAVGAADIFLVIDDSYSMKKAQIASGVTRKDAVIASAKTLATKLLALNPNMQVGVVSFSSSANEGTLEDAKLRIEPTSNAQAVQGAIEDIQTHTYDGARTNIDAGLQTANNHFSATSKNKKRYIIVLTDGVPNNAVGGPTLTYSGEVASKTKATIQTLRNSGISIYTVMIGLDGQTVEPSTGITYKGLAEEVFGTTVTPFVDKFFYVSDSQLETTITNSVYQEVMSTLDKPLENIVIKDYFPQEIIDNFDFTYIASPNIGEVSTQIDKQTGCITWTIDVLQAGEIGTLSYKLTLKENYNKEIIDVVLPTNTKVDITYDDNGEDKTKTSPDAPTIVVKYQEPTPEPDPTPTPTPDLEPEPEPQPQPEPQPDPTIAPDPIPQTGVKTILIGLTAVGLLTYTGTRIWKIQNINKQ